MTEDTTDTTKPAAEDTEEAAAPPDSPRRMTVITTAIGAFGPEGIAEVGTRREIMVDAFSDAWMKPATKADAKKLQRHRDDA